MRYIIVPINNYRSEPIEADNADDAIIEFATIMDTDMNLYFKAIPENEIENYLHELNYETHAEFVTDFMLDELMENYGVKNEDYARELAEIAYDRYCEGNGETEGECIEATYVEEYDESRDIIRKP